jgi:hypothetical protein
MDALSSLKTALLRWIHKLVTQMLLSIHHVRFHVFRYSFSSSGYLFFSCCVMTVDIGGAVRLAQYF